MLLRKIIYTIWEELEGLNITDDSLIDYEYLKDKIISWNNTLITDAVRNKEPLTGFYQVMTCLEVTCHKGSCVLNGFTFTDSEPYYLVEMPPLAHIPEPIQFFGSGMMTGGIGIVGNALFQNSDGNRFTATSPRATLVGDTIILKNLPTLAFSLATAIVILSDPTQACNWSEYDNSEFPTPSTAKLIMLVKKDILSTLGRPDLVHDSQVAIGQPRQRQPVSDDGGQE